MTPGGFQKDLVLLGGGHAHALALRMLAMRSLPGVRMTLVSLDPLTPYSGMLPGLIAGHYNLEETHIDLPRLCRKCGVRFIAARAIGIDRQAQKLLLEGRPPLDFDVLSIDIGSQPALDAVPGAAEFATPVKPVHTFYQRWQQVERRLSSGDDTHDEIAMVGGGAGSVELALSMRHRLLPRKPSIRLVCGGGLLESYNPHARRSVRRYCQQNDIEIVEGARVVEVSAGLLRTRAGEQLSYTELFWCTAAGGVSWLRDTGLPCDDRGFLEVDDDLRVRGSETIFAAGDTATQVAHPRPKAGVYAVRQAPTLAHNLAAIFAGKPLRLFRPQKRFLSLLAVGDRRAVADRSVFSASGAWVWRWKDRIDRGFMDSFSELEMSMPDAAPPLGEVMHCGGCGAKLQGGILRASQKLLEQEFPQVIPADGFVDDAAVLSLPADATLLQSVDVLRGLLDDPWLMGRIAVLHAFSDLYAMGARPHSALANLCIPYAHPRIQQRDLQHLLLGAAFELDRAGAMLLGGHTLEGPELNIGFTVNGLLTDGAVLAKKGLRVGDHLILSKPLGTGVLFAADQQGLAGGRHLQAAIDGMLQDSAAAAEITRDCGASACTDVTGFGLAGHLAEMLQAGGVQVRLELQTLPLLAGAQAGWECGIESSLQEANRLAVSAYLAQSPNPADPLQQALFDPQTCGGLLFGVAAHVVDEVVSKLDAAGYTRAADIGVVEAAAGDPMIRWQE